MIHGPVFTKHWVVRMVQLAVQLASKNVLKKYFNLRKYVDPMFIASHSMLPAKSVQFGL